jgi:hypothetical protein
VKRATPWLLVLALGAVVGVDVYRIFYPSILPTPSQPSHTLKRTGDPSLYPPPQTPGALDPQVTEANIQQTICVPGYTRTVRPPVRITNKIKRELMQEYGLAGSPSDYELDHIVPLELGGCGDCLTNLWMEPLDDARKKDRVENYLRREVCQNRIRLEQAQKQIIDDWVAVTRHGPFQTLAAKGFSNAAPPSGR